MKKLFFILFLFTVSATNAQNGNDNRAYSLKEVDEAPAPEGMTFDAYFRKNFKLSEKITDPIQLSFVVEKGGVIRDIKVFKDAGHGSGKEAIRVMKASPKWKPGKKDGKIVRVLYTATIKI